MSPSRRSRHRLLILALAGLALAVEGCGSGPDLSKPSGGGGGPLATSPLPVAAPSQVAATPTPGVAPAAIQEARRLTLEFPPTIRLGDSDVVRLTVEVDDLGNLTSTAEVAGNTVIGRTVQIPNLYDTHDVFAEARIDLSGMEVRPAEQISEPLLPGGSATFYWSLRPARPGTFRGTVWLHLRFVDKLSGTESRIAVAAQPLQIEARQLFGLSGSLARTAGGVGSLIGAILGFPFIDDLLKWLFNRRRRPRPNS